MTQHDRVRRVPIQKLHTMVMENFAKKLGMPEKVGIRVCIVRFTALCLYI